MDNAAVQEVSLKAPKKRKKLFGSRGADKASLGSISSFCLSNFFTSGFGEYIASYFVLFLTDFMLLPTVQITILMLVTRIIDAFTDPIMGGIVDITHSKYGKCRPYILGASIPLGIFYVLMFIVPDFSIMGRLVYVYVIYIGYGIASTVYGVPMSALSVSISADPKERKNIYTIAGLASSLGTSIPGFVPILLEYIANSRSQQETAYFVIALIIGLGVAISGVCAFFMMKEKVVSVQTVKHEKVKLTKNIKAIFKNRPLICILLSSVALSLRQMGYGAAIYFYKETMHNYALATFIGILSSIPTYIFMAAVPWLAKKYSPRNLCIVSYLAMAAAFLVFFFVGYDSVFWVAFFIVISGLPNGLIRTCSKLIIADSVDYMEWRTGIRSEGLVFSVEGLKNKATSTLSGMWLPLGLSIIGYHTAQSSAELVIQSDATKQGLFYLVTLAPMAGALFAALPLFFDNFYGKRRDAIFEELAERRSKAKAEIEAQNGLELAGAGADGAEVAISDDNTATEEIATVETTAVEETAASEVSEPDETTKE